MIDREEHQLILEVAVMYYLENKNQSQIAKELFISRSKVSRLLKKARENHFVDISINYKSEAFEDLQTELRRMFNIRNVFITKTVQDELGTLKEVTKLAAKELGLMLHDDMTIGISWGRHVGMTTKFLAERAYKDIRIVELFGAINYQNSKIDTASVGRRMCERLNAKLFSLPAPIYIYDAVGRKEVMNSAVVKNTLEKIDECDLIITSIGTVEGDNLQTLWHNYLESDMRVEVNKHNGVGSMLAHFFNQKGEFIESKINESIVGIKTEEIKNKKIFAIASGRKKAKAILGALRGGMLNTLVSDEKTIRAVLDLVAQEKK